MPNRRMTLWAAKLGVVRTRRQTSSPPPRPEFLRARTPPLGKAMAVIACAQAVSVCYLTTGESLNTMA
jgi:hypothetical protein